MWWRMICVDFWDDSEGGYVNEQEVNVHMETSIEWKNENVSSAWPAKVYEADKNWILVVLLLVFCFFTAHAH